MRKPSDLECVVLAGGLATRMRPHTEALPKVLLPVGGEPFASHQLRWLAAQGVQRVVFCVGYLGDQVRAFVRDGAEWGLEVEYVDEGDYLRGTAGAVRLGLDQGRINGGSFLLTYGDSLLDVDVAAVVREFDSAGLPALMVVIENDRHFGPSNARFERGLVTCYSKAPTGTDDLAWLDYGLSVFSAAAVRELVPPATHVDLATVQARLCEQRLMAGFVAERRFREIGSLEGWRDLDTHLLRVRGTVDER